MWNPPFPKTGYFLFSLSMDDQPPAFPIPDEIESESSSDIDFAENYTLSAKEIKRSKEKNAF